MDCRTAPTSITVKKKVTQFLNKILQILPLCTAVSNVGSCWDNWVVSGFSPKSRTISTHRCIEPRVSSGGILVTVRNSNWQSYRGSLYYADFGQNSHNRDYTAIPYRARTGPEQGFFCVLILTGKNLFSLQGTLFSLQGSCIHYREFPVRISTQGNPCSHYREWVCSVVIIGFSPQSVNITGFPHNIHNLSLWVCWFLDNLLAF